MNGPFTPRPPARAPVAIRSGRSLPHPTSSPVRTDRSRRTSGNGSRRRPSRRGLTTNPVRTGRSQPTSGRHPHGRSGRAAPAAPPPSPRQERTVQPQEGRPGAFVPAPRRLEPGVNGPFATGPLVEQPGAGARLVAHPPPNLGANGPFTPGLPWLAPVQGSLHQPATQPRCERTVHDQRPEETPAGNPAGAASPPPTSA